MRTQPGFKNFRRQVHGYLFAPRWHFSRFSFNLLTTFLIFTGFVVGVYFALNKLWSNVFALNDTYQTWEFNSGTSGNYTYGGQNIEFDGSSVKIKNRVTNPGFESDLSSWTLAQSYSLNDQFTTTRSAGAVNGTSAEPTGGTRTVTDTNSKISIGSGLLSFATGEAANDGIWWSVKTRAAGKMVTGTLTPSNTTSTPKFGFSASSGGAYNDGIRLLASSVIDISPNGGAAVAVADSWSATSYNIAIIMRSSGMYYYIKGGAYTNWTLLYISSAGSADKYPLVQTHTTSSIFTADNVKVPSSTWLPTPLAYDTFTRSDGTVGSSETTGPDSQTAPSLSYTGGTISGNKLVITPTLGSDLTTNGNFEGSFSAGLASGWTKINGGTLSQETTIVHGGSSAQKDITVSSGDGIAQQVSTTGSWYQDNIWAYVGAGVMDISIGNNSLHQRVSAKSTASWQEFFGTYRATGTSQGFYLRQSGATATTFYADDASKKQLTLSSLFSTVPTSKADVIADANVTLTAGTQAGVVTNLDSASSPNNFIIAYHDGTSVYLDKNVGGTYTNLFKTAATYSAGAPLRVITYHSDVSTLKVRVYYNNVLISSEQTITDAGIRDNTIHGLFSTYSTNSFDNFTLFARGTGGEYGDIPAEDLTITRDTATAYSSTASAKLVSVNDANFVESINVGDTEVYSLSTYAYTSGVAVTSSDLSLFYNGTTISTTYTSVGGGWYKLSGTIIGAASSRDYGVRVKAGKTVYVDSFRLNRIGGFALFNTDAYENENVGSWDSFDSEETAPSGTSVRYQICTDEGSVCEAGVTAHWQYFSGGAWNNATNITSHYNSSAELNNAAMSELSVLSKKLSVKTILITDGSEIPSIQSVAVGLTTDIVPPSTNASSIGMDRVLGGEDVSEGSWTNNLSPYFTWSAGADNIGGIGLRGYCLYLGTDPEGDPATSKGLLGTSPVDLGDSTCQFIISGTNIDLATLAYRGVSWLTASNSSYYLNIKAIDEAENIFPTLNASFEFKYDNVAPTNVSYISCASGNFSNIADMNFAWPTSGGVAASDSNSGVAVYQYQINSTAGEWVDVSGTSYTLQNDVDDEITSGNNVVYFRSVDTAENTSSDATIRTCNLAFGGEAPQFGGSDVVTVSPSTSTSNAFAVSYPEATPAIGREVTNYYYMVNTLPPSTLATLQGNASTYIDNGTELNVPEDSLANVNKGSNTIYVVAVDDEENYSPSNYITGSFTLNSNDPDNVGNLVATDSSIKASSLWNVTLTWTAPEYQGAGNLQYLVYRSSDGDSFTQVGSAAGLSYVDNTPTSDLYYFKVVTKDGADQLSSGTNAVSITPTGKWTSAASLESEPTVTSITTKKAVVTWSTDRGSDSKVAIGTKSGVYSDDEISNSSQLTSHTINLSNLKPETNYYFKAKWTDEDGNTGESEEKTFTTLPAPTVFDVTTQNVGLTSAIVRYTVNGASKVKIYYGISNSFGGVKEVLTSTSETTYITELEDLADGTKYFYKINKYDSDGGEYEGDTYVFETLPRPKISGVRLETVANTAQTTVRVIWNTNTQISSIVTYSPEGSSSQSRDEVNVKLEKGKHEMIVRGLMPTTRYSLIVKGRDRLGNEARSDIQLFTTATDTRSPQVLNLKVIGGTIPPVGFAAGEVKAQLIVTWDTDEPSSSQVEFGEGSGSSYSQKSQYDGNLTTNHTVILSGLVPSQVYHLRAVSADSVGNVSQSIDLVTIAPKATRSALDLVIRNLSEAFGFIGSIGIK